MVAVDRMPAFPRSVQKVLELTRNINCLPRELVGVIEKDPVMTMKILKVINSAYYSLPNKITSINQSVVYLGINTIKNLSLSFAAVGILPRTNTAGFDIQQYLVHSLATAAVARQLCSVYAKGEADPGECYVAGLLHDFGKVVFAQFLAEEFRNALERAAANHLPLYQVEREIIGADHGVVGAMLAKRWQFPDHLVMCIRDHHLEGAESSAMMDCLRGADRICRGAGLGGDSYSPGMDAHLSELPQRFGHDLEKVMAALGDFEKIVSEARTFVAVDGEA
jgi:putative nucleotidyltransferase with HDIG domain